MTGASSGIGRASALTPARASYRVIGTGNKVGPYEMRDDIRIIACNVTSDESVCAAGENPCKRGKIGRF